MQTSVARINKSETHRIENRKMYKIILLALLITMPFIVENEAKKNTYTPQVSYYLKHGLHSIPSKFHLVSGQRKKPRGDVQYA